MNFRMEVCAKAKNPALALQWVNGIEAAKSLADLITPISVTGQDFFDYEEMYEMMAAALKKCYEKANTLPKEDQCRRGRELERTTDFSEEG